MTAEIGRVVCSRVATPLGKQFPDLVIDSIDKTLPDTTTGSMAFPPEEMSSDPTAPQTVETVTSAVTAVSLAEYASSTKLPNLIYLSYCDLVLPLRTLKPLQPLPLQLK